ncbi:FAD binding domain-containing protein [Biscogniauxia mediterranea]|nr:FAD binding domain-containing protein [Biscogniauxia mediterranea]
MISKTFVNALAFLASTAAAFPTLEIRSGDALVQYLKRATTPSLNFTISPDASIITPDSPNWENETIRWSTWSAPSYSVAFVPAEEQDIVTGLRYMSSHNISFLAMGGGHGNTLTLGTVENAVLINMQQFNNITVNPDDTITIGGGSRFGAVYDVAYAAGRELPLGSCPCVGVGGASLGGGHGRLQGVYGLIVDAIVSLRVALWDGSIVTASATENPDLFWAMRGAGHNFGIVIDFTFKTWPLSNDGLVYNADMTFTTDSLEGLLDNVNQLIPDQDPGLALDIFITTDHTTGETSISLNIVYAGTREEGDAFTALFASSSNSTRYPIERLDLNVTMTPWNLLPQVAANGSIVHACTEGVSYNVYTANLRNFDLVQQREILTSYQNFVVENPLAVGTLIFYEIFGQKAVLEQPAEETSAGNRDYANVLAILQTTYTDDAVADAADAWGHQWRDQLILPQHSGYDIESVYMNYAHGDEPLEAMYGWEPWRLERLRSLKARYDPHGFFNHYNSVLGTEL